jgi:hypothetical protein
MLLTNYSNLSAIFGLVGIVESGIEDLINLGKLDAEEHAVESAFTQQMVRELRSKYPNKNVLIYHDQKSKFNGVNVAHQHVECSLDFFTTTQGYEVDVFDSGTFTLVGDGGYINWCFDGNYVHDGNSVTFNPITSKSCIFTHHHYQQS